MYRLILFSCLYSFIHVLQLKAFGSEILFAIRLTQKKIAVKYLSVLFQHDGSKARAEVVYRIHEIILGDITSEEQLPEALALAESYIFKIDKIAQKCIEITFRMETNKKLDAFWKLYQTGGLKAALIRDILTPQKRRLMKKEAEIAGIHISIDVSICEDNYLFVKDFLQSREGEI